MSERGAGTSNRRGRPAHTASRVCGHTTIKRDSLAFGCCVGFSSQCLRCAIMRRELAALLGVNSRTISCLLTQNELTGHWSTFPDRLGAHRTIVQPAITMLFHAPPTLM